METETKELSSVWKGSGLNWANVAGQIKEIWGKEAADSYDPRVNCFTYRGWQERGYQVKRGEKALHSITFIGGSESVKQADGSYKDVSRVYPKSVCLFFINQVEKREVK